jgi:uncharacterized membrane protein YccC
MKLTLPNLQSLPTASELEFSVKTFAAAMLAMYFSMRIGLTSPYWALTTVYIVSTAQTGTLRSKGMYRVLGTIISAAVAVFIMPPLANSPELLTLALALWCGLCLFISLLDRTPRSYMFMMAGYTVAIITFPAVNAPQEVFIIAINRVEEIALGIVCTTLIHTLVFPHSFGPSLVARFDKALSDARHWIREALDSSPEQAQQDRRKLASDLTEIRLLATHLPFDTSHLRWTTNIVVALHAKLTSIAPLISAVEDRLQALRDIGKTKEEARLTPEWHALLKDIAEWVQSSSNVAAIPQRAEQLRQRLHDLMPTLQRDASWSTLLKINLAMRLRSIVNTAEECLTLRQYLSAGQQGAMPPEAAQYQGLPSRVLHRDYRLAIMSGIAAALTVIACCALWIVTGWPAASGMPILAAVVVSIFATQDDPAPSMKTFMLAQIKGIPISAIYLLFLIPSVHSFESLVIVTAPLFIPLGIYCVRPATARKAVPMLFGITGALGLQASNTSTAAVIPDVISFINSIIPQIAGMTLAMFVTRLMRSVSAGWTARRVLHAGWKELAAMSSTDKVPSVAEMSARMLDRISQLTPRLSAAEQYIDTSAVDAMRDLRIGLNMTQLVRFQPQLATAVSLQPLVRELSAHFRQQMQKESAPPATLVERIDAGLRGVCAAEGFDGRREAAAALVGIRRDLFPAAPDYLEKS